MIVGYSDKTIDDLISFFESEGRSRGFIIKNNKGQRFCYINAKLFNNVSYYIKNI